ncbi:MAG: DUF192 domain-containing protein [Candidatus Omnitrophota bacterium]|jgi:uncharacterized membrane protein (UPF0127 family)
MRKSQIIIVFLFLAAIVFCGYADSKTKKIQVNIHNKTYTFELAQTQEELKRGLMFREELGPESGMFFIFEKADYLTFYMKDTFIPLDIAFIDDNFTIVDIQPLHPLDMNFVVSKVKAIYALEVNRGFFQSLGLGIGDKIELVTILEE